MNAAINSFDGTKRSLSPVPSSRDPQRLGDVIQWLEQHNKREAKSPDKINATLELLDYGSSEDCVTLSRAIEAANGVHIVSMCVSMNVLPQLISVPEGNCLLQLICPRLAHLDIIPSNPDPQSQEHLLNAARLLLKCKNLKSLGIGRIGCRGFTDQCLDNFAKALGTLKSLECLFLHNRCIGDHGTKLLGPVFRALGTLPKLFMLHLDDWIPPMAEQPKETEECPFAQLLNRICLFQTFKKLPDALRAIQCSQNIRTLVVGGNGGCCQETYRLLGDLICPPSKECPGEAKLDKAIRLEKLMLNLGNQPNESHVLDFIQNKLKKSTKIKKFQLEFYRQPSNKIQLALHSVLACNLTLSSIKFKPVQIRGAAQLPQIFIHPAIIKLCMNRNRRCEALVQDPQANNQQIADFLLEHKSCVNATFYLLSKNHSIIEFLAAGAGNDQVQPAVARKKRKLTA